MSVQKYITLVFSLIVAALCVHIYTRTFYSAGNVAVIVSISMFLAPVLVAAIICMIRRKAFHYIYWVCATILILLLNVALFFVFMRPAVKSPGPNSEDVNNYFKARRGLFTRFFYLYQAYEYPEAYYPRAYIAKIVYRVGGPQSKDIYIGKVLMDVNGKVIEEFYDQPAGRDTALFAREFGESVKDLKWIVPLIKR